MKSLALPHMRRLAMAQQSTMLATRSYPQYHQFTYPHGFMNTNSAYLHIPRNAVNAPQEFKVGDKAPLAHQDTRKFPEWYKPYQFNYFSDGYMLLGFFIMALFGYSYINDICQMKGRRQRKVF